MSSTVDVVVIGAGAAGLAAGRALGAGGLTSVVLEADARVGGRAHTEIMPDGAPFDLGCHWMHSASLNPFVDTADALGVRYERREGYGRSGFFRQGVWVEDVEVAAAFRAMNERQKSVADAWSQGLDQSVFDTVERDGPWTEVLDFYDTLNTSSDVDQISIGDLVSYNEYFGWYYSRYFCFFGFFFITFFNWNHFTTNSFYLDNNFFISWCFCIIFYRNYCWNLGRKI